MKAMILAAGRGERMRPLTDFTPKPLLKVGGKPLIVWHLERLAQAGFKHIVINHAHLGSQIEQALGNGAQWGLSIQYSAETTALETAGGIANAMHLLSDLETDAPFLVVNGDTYTDIDFAQLHLAQDKLAHLVLVDNPPQHPAGDFAIADATLNGMGDLSDSGQPRYTFSGVGIYRPALFANIKAGQSAKLAPLLREAIAHKQATAKHYAGVWHDIGTPQRLQELDEWLTQHGAQ